MAQVKKDGLRNLAAMKSCFCQRHLCSCAHKCPSRSVSLQPLSTLTIKVHQKSLQCEPPCGRCRMMLRHYEVQNLVVKPSSRRKGVASQIICWCATQSRRRGATQLWMHAPWSHLDYLRLDTPMKCDTPS